MTIILPTNGALMNADQFDELRLELAVDGTPREKSMFLQMSYMVYGATAHRLTLENERTCRMTAETKLREARLKITKVKALLNRPVSKLKVKDLRGLLESALEEIGEDEDAGTDSMS